jgi:urocanate hydratase
MGELREGLRAEMGEVRQELGAEIAETRRHLGVVAENLRSEIRMVADGVALANERINQVDLRVDGLTGEMRRGFAGVRAEIHSLHEADDELRGRIEAQERRGA